MRPRIEDNPNQSNVRSDRIMSAPLTAGSNVFSFSAHQGSSTMDEGSRGNSVAWPSRHHRMDFGSRTIPMRRLLLILAMVLLIAPTANSQTSWSSSKNIFDGHDYRGPGGQRVTSRANIFGGYDYTSSDGKSWTSRKNIYGGQDFRGSSGRRSTSRKNIFGGQDYSGRPPTIFGGKN